MSTAEQINACIAGQPEPKRSEMEQLHQRILQLLPGCKLWYLDGRDDNNKVVANPNIGYGSCRIKYADGTTREFYQVGLSANTTGISVYIMGLSDRTWLAKTYAGKIGRASVSGYCIKFKSLKDINVNVLEDAIRQGVEETRE